MRDRDVVEKPKSTFMKIVESFSQIGGFCVFMHYIFSFGASYINKRLYLSEVMQQRYTMHKNVDLDFSNNPNARYMSQFDVSRGPPSSRKLAPRASARSGVTAGEASERQSARSKAPTARSGRNEGGEVELTATVTDEEAMYMGG